jgi:hypothetical protein
MTDDSLYQIINGEPMVSTRGMALLMGVTVEEIKDAWDPTAQKGYMVPRPEWVRNGVRRRKECAAALGHEPSLVESLDYWAEASADGPGLE